MALDLSAQKPPPLRAASSPKPRASNNSQRKQREEGLNGLFQLAGGACLMFGQWADAGACTNHGPNISRETAALAEENASIAKTIDYLTSVGPYAGLLTAVLPFALQILVNHGRIPAHPSLMQIGVLPPDLLSAQSQAEVAKAQAQYAEQMADARREQEEAMRNLAQAAESNNEAA